MAKFYGRRNTYRGKRKRYKRWKSRREYAAEITAFAKKMGQVSRGLKNPDSRISAAYKSGEQKKVYNRKPLF